LNKKDAGNNIQEQEFSLQQYGTPNMMLASYLKDLCSDSWPCYLLVWQRFLTLAFQWSECIYTFIFPMAYHAVIQVYLVEKQICSQTQFNMW